MSHQSNMSDSGASVKRILAVQVIYKIEAYDLAREVCYGIEEEGLPYCLVPEDEAPWSAYETTLKSGLGTAVDVQLNEIHLYSRLLKEASPLLSIKNPGMDEARIMGKNAARIIKNRPLVEI